MQYLHECLIKGPKYYSLINILNTTPQVAIEFYKPTMLIENKVAMF